MEDLNKATFDARIQDEKVLVDFWAPWCGPCKAQAPILEELDKELDDVRFAKLNVDDEPELAQKYRVRGIPTLILFEKGKESRRMVGVQSKQVLLQVLQP